jgi:hypothetical protein
VRPLTCARVRQQLGQLLPEREQRVLQLRRAIAGQEDAQRVAGAVAEDQRVAAHVGQLLARGEELLEVARQLVREQEEGLVRRRYRAADGADLERAPGAEVGKGRAWGGAVDQEAQRLYHGCDQRRRQPRQGRLHALGDLVRDDLGA